MENQNAETPKRYKGTRQIERRQIAPKKTQNNLSEKKQHVSKPAYKNSWKKFFKHSL